MSYKESQFQTLFNKYCKAHFKDNGAFELKITHGGSLPFSDVKPHQVKGLLCVKHATAAFKLADDSIGVKPYDSFCLSKTYAYIVIMFYAKQSKFVMIDIDDFVNETNISKRKSITEDRAYQIGKVINIKSQL